MEKKKEKCETLLGQASALSFNHKSLEHFANVSSSFRREYIENGGSCTKNEMLRFMNDVSSEIK